VINVIFEDYLIEVLNSVSAKESSFLSLISTYIDCKISDWALRWNAARQDWACNSGQVGCGKFGVWIWLQYSLGPALQKPKRLYAALSIVPLI